MPYTLDTPITDRCLFEVDRDGTTAHCGLPLDDTADLTEVFCPRHLDAEDRGEITADNFDELRRFYQAEV